ncbi:response regulator receiver protein [Methanocaldococcus sp. FS406-22]|uniref:response regulator n=1 Tax=Methanocaldococcus sp. (strain FS406-22) TaxID=644281 RepID=UPI0001C4E120|nr:response regulator [Methanocaldococcus sp. FS406-22]ADC68938.1 response regulator receiver protein [Methanocaldococcus sp. FS406-22]
MAKILVVEDEEDILNLIKIILDMEGHSTILTKDGEEGIKALEDNDDISLIILDIKMPNMNGWEFLEIIKNNDKWKDIPVIVLTAYTQVSDIEKAKEMGVESYIAKPFSREELIREINYIIK